MNGLTAERIVARELVKAGYLVSSRRHIAGAGDILAANPDHTRPILVEVKGTTRPPWHSTFGPAQRDDLVQTAFNFKCDPLLAWLPEPGFLFWLPYWDFPDAHS